MYHNRFLTKGLSVLFALLGMTSLQGCGAEATSLSFTEKLIVAMLGEYTDPVDLQTSPEVTANQTKTSAPVSGDGDPKNQIITITGITLTPSAGDVINLFEGEEATTYTIVDRSQIIFEADLSEYKGSQIAAITLTFQQSALATTPNDKEVAFNLPAATFTHTQDWTVTAAITKRLQIVSQWKNTISVDETSGNESVESPSIKTLLSDD